MLLVLTRLGEQSSAAIHAPNSTAALPARLTPYPRAHDRKAHRFTRREREAAPAKLERKSRASARLHAPTGTRIGGNSVELFRDWMRVSAFAAITPPGF